MFDSKSMNEYLKRLSELESSFNKVNLGDQQAESQYLDQVESLVLKIESSEALLSKITAKK